MKSSATSKAIYQLVLLVATILGPVFTITAQEYIWDESGNYSREHNNPQFKYCYKIDCPFAPTCVFYEMTSMSSFDKEIEVVNLSKNDEYSVFSLTVSIDGNDTVLVTDSLATIKIDHVPHNIKIRTITRPNGIVVPMAKGEIPHRIFLEWGDTYGGWAILTIKSKSPLDFNELRVIRDKLICGRETIESDEYYYYFSRN